MKGTCIKKRLIRLAAAAMTAITMLTTLSFSASAKTVDTKYGTIEIQTSSWMASLPDDTKINEMSIPGAHDATTRNVDYVMEVFAQTQDRYIKDLLEIGVRYFDLRICRDKDTLYMCHQSVDCYDSEDYRLRLSDVIYDMKVFLNQHPSETILLQVKCDRTENDAENETWKYFKNMAEKGELYCGDHAPTLGEARGKFLLLNRLNFGENTQFDKYVNVREDGSYSCWGLDVHDFHGGNTTDKTMALTSKNTELGYYVWTEDMYNVPKEEKWDYVCNSLLGSCNAAYRRDEARKMGCDAFNIIYASMSYQNWVRVALEVINPLVDLVDTIIDKEGMVWPKEAAYYINPKLRELLEKNTNLYTGCLVCDYIDSFLARAIYMTNFDVPADSMVQYGGSW